MRDEVNRDGVEEVEREDRRDRAAVDRRGDVEGGARAVAALLATFERVRFEAAKLREWLDGRLGGKESVDQILRDSAAGSGADR